MKKLLSLLTTTTLTTTGLSGITILSNIVNTNNINKYNNDKQIFEWSDVNPFRNNSVTEKVNQSENYHFQPYFDCGMYQGPNVHEAIQGIDTTLHDGTTVFNQVKNLKSTTVAFVNQAKGITDHLKFTVASQTPDTDAYNWFKDKNYIPNILNPMAKSENFKNLVVSYGGANGTNYAPWTWAWNLSHENETKAIDMLEVALKEYQARITDFAGLYYSETPKNLDFDIEGGLLSQDLGLKVLYKTMAKMKLEDPSWNFSLTLGIWPNGLPLGQIKIIQDAISEYVNSKLTVNDIFNLNIMAMDYGKDEGKSVIQNHQTFFSVAKNAIDNSTKQFQTVINKAFNTNLPIEEVYKKMMVTPMIGINDVTNNYLTLEDAKDLYNYAQKVNLYGIRMWSLNRDTNGDINEDADSKSHGLKYLNKFDFAHAFSGQWEYWVKNPIHKV